MNKTIKKLVSICIISLAFAVIMSACHKPAKRIYFEFPMSGGAIDIPIGAETDKDINDIYRTSNITLNEDDAPREVTVDSICSILYSDHPFYYDESVNVCGRLFRCYKYMTKTGRGWCDYYPQQNKLRSFYDTSYSDIIKARYMELTEDALLSKEQCFDKAKTVLASLYDNVEQFVRNDKNDYDFGFDGIDVKCVDYNFQFRREVEGVEICSVEITVRNDGEIVGVTNVDCITNDYYDKTSNINLKVALKEADDAVCEKVKTFGADYSAKYESAKLLLGMENRLVLKVQYELWYDGFSGSVVNVYVVL